MLVRGTTSLVVLMAGIGLRFLQTLSAQKRLATALCTAIITVSLLSLTNNYRYPKQDFGSALQYVEKHRNKNDSVITVGLTTYPYLRYYKMPWMCAETLQELRSARSSTGATWLIYTFPDHLNSLYPEIWKSILSEYTLVREFRNRGRWDDICLQERPAPRLTKNPGTRRLVLNDSESFALENRGFPAFFNSLIVKGVIMAQPVANTDTEKGKRISEAPKRSVFLS